MTREEALEVLTTHTQFKCNGNDLVALDMAIKALEQEPCEDAISRQVVLDMVEELKKIHFDRVVVLNKVCERVLELPPITPKPKTGHWIVDEYGIKHCPFCNAINNSVYDSYCPHCGCQNIVGVLEKVNVKDIEEEPRAERVQE